MSSKKFENIGDMDLIRNFTRNQINVSGITNYGDIQKGNELEWAFSMGDNSMKFKKSGKELKTLLLSKRNDLLSKMEACSHKMESVKVELAKDNILPWEDTVQWDSETNDEKDKAREYWHLKHKLESKEQNLALVDTMLENITDNKSYTLTLKQLSALK